VARNPINLLLDEALVRRVRQQANEAIGKSDAEIVEDALSAYLDDRVFAAAARSARLSPARRIGLRSRNCTRSVAVAATRRESRAGISRMSRSPERGR
jgi:hypothetical protein